MRAMHTVVTRAGNARPQRIRLRSIAANRVTCSEIAITAHAASAQTNIMKKSMFLML